MNPRALTLDLVRHGEVATPGLICAHSEEPLSDQGQRQLAQLETGPSWDLVISSPSRRCREFAEKLSLLRNIPLITQAELREIDLGHWTGRTTESIWETDRQRLLQLWNNPGTFTAPGGERMVDFSGRVERAIAELIAEYPGQNALLLTHAGVIRVIIAKLLGISAQNVQKFRVAHGRINRLCIFPDGGISLVSWGCAPPDLAQP